MILFWRAPERRPSNATVVRAFLTYLPNVCQRPASKATVVRNPPRKVLLVEVCFIVRNLGRIDTFLMQTICYWLRQSLIRSTGDIDSLSRHGGSNAPPARSLVRIPQGRRQLQEYSARSFRKFQEPVQYPSSARSPTVEEVHVLYCMSPAFPSAQSWDRLDANCAHKGELEY
jgi:hypothetical protein